MNPAPLPSSLHAIYLRHLLHLRLVSLAGQTLAYAAAARVAYLGLPLGALSALGIALLVYTLVALRRLPSRGAVGQTAVLAETALDLFCLTVSLYLAGGASNPLVALLLLPVAVAGATLELRPIWWVAGLAAVCYTLLMFVYRPLALGHHDEGAFELHVWGMWYGFLLSALLVALFVARMGATLRAHDRALARAQEQALRGEQWVALGTLAAGAAHELGTPLATMAVVASDLADEHSRDPGLAGPLGVLCSQVERCKGILSRMALEAGGLRADAGRPLALDDYLAELVEEWRALRPAVHLDARWSGTCQAPQIVADRTLTQAIHNVMHNAADASPESVELRAEWEKGQLRIAICDRGEGMDLALHARIGQPLVSGKSAQGGLGLGLCLARTVLERLGGRIALTAREPVGLCVRVVLPLAPLETEGVN
jgi:two-component system sensor histidine kinase RegB